MAKRGRQAQADQPAFPKHPLAAKRPKRDTSPPVHNARGYTMAEWTAAGYDQEQFDTAQPAGEGQPASAIVADLVAELRGPNGDAILAKIKAHHLAPLSHHAGRSAKALTPAGLAHALQFGRESLWYDAAEAVARELAAEGELATSDVPPNLESISDEAAELCLDCGHPWRFHTNGGMCQGTAEGIECHCCMIPESIGTETAGPPPQPIEHLARCATCGFSVRFRPTASGTGFVLDAGDLNLGIGANGRPICREDAHGEMALADEQLVPASEAIGQVAARANGQPEQRKLPLPVTEPNWQAMLQQTTDLRRDVRQRIARWKDVHDKAAQLKKLADEAQTRLSEWEDTCEERAREWAAYVEQCAEQAEREAQEAAGRDDGDEAGETSDGEPIAMEAGSGEAGEAVL